MRSGSHPAEAQPAANRPKNTFTTASARTTAIEYTRAERLWFCLERPIPQPRLPRPSIRNLLRSIPQLIPARLKTSRCGRLAAAHPGLAAWLFILAGLAPLIATHEPATPHPTVHPALYQKWLVRKGTETIRASLVGIGPSVEVPTVQAAPIEQSTLGTYNLRTSEITFNSSLEYEEIDLLYTSAHELVHGIFHQNKLWQELPADEDFFWLVNEIAAYVLGAYIAGDAWSRRGIDGSVVTEHLFLQYRLACDPDVPTSRYCQFLTTDAVASGKFDRDEWHSMLIHFGAPLQLVDAVYEICYLNSDPVEAARTISRRFMTRNLAPRDRHLLEEFERIRARGEGL